MLLSNFFFGILLATTAYALPTARERLNARAARRASNALHPEVVTFDASTAPRAKFSSRPKISNVTHDEYSSNWGGAVLSEGAVRCIFNLYILCLLTHDLQQGTWTGVTGTFTVPVPSEPSGDSAGWASASAWVGIDGDTCGSAILQTGVDFTIQNGAVSYDGLSPSPRLDFTCVLTWSSLVKLGLSGSRTLHPTSLDSRFALATRL